MKFNLDDFLQLDVNGLLAVNGGCVNYYDCSKNNSNKGSKWSWFSSIEAFENNYGSGDSACYKDFDYYGL